MGCDIFASIEVRKDPAAESWSAVADAGKLIGRDSAVFGYLFGMGGLLLFEPLFFVRGVPEGCDDHTRDFVLEGTSGWSWFTLAEFLAVDLEEESKSTLVDLYRVGEDGAEKHEDRLFHSPLSPPFQERLERDGEVQYGDRLYRLGRMTRREALEGFETALAVMQQLGERYGPDHVRIVVGFNF